MAPWKSPSRCWVLGEQQTGSGRKVIAAGQKKADQGSPAPCRHPAPRAAVPEPRVLWTQELCLELQSSPNPLVISIFLQ